MCPRIDRTGRLVLGIGVGLLLSLLFSGWFVPALIGIALVVLGLLISSC